jgi:hypothetical protein
VECCTGKDERRASLHACLVARLSAVVVVVKSSEVRRLAVLGAGPSTWRSAHPPFGGRCDAEMSKALQDTLFRDYMGVTRCPGESALTDANRLAVFEATLEFGCFREMVFSRGG